MPESQKSKSCRSFIKAIVLMLLGGLLVKWALEHRRVETPVAARPVPGRGEFGGELQFLKRFHLGPQVPGESNHYLDMWNPGGVRTLTKYHGLTNNHALFVDSHGKAAYGWHGARYGFYPHKSVLRPGEQMPGYSAQDLATVLGPEHAASIHNIVLAGCNEEGRLRSAEFRRHFANATNITFMLPGKLAYKPMFYQAITEPSSEIRPLYGKVMFSTADRTESSISNTPGEGTEPLGFFVANLFLPGATKPYRTQPAGRELLDPVASTGKAKTPPPLAVVRR